MSEVKTLSKSLYLRSNSQNAPITIKMVSNCFVYSTRNRTENSLYPILDVAVKKFHVVKGQTHTANPSMTFDLMKLLESNISDRVNYTFYESETI